jgi:predicted nucleic acid-binding protein
MILADTSVWIDHLRSGIATLGVLLESQRVWMHPFVLGEIACGNVAQRHRILAELSQLPAAPQARDAEVLEMIEFRGLAGRGIGYIDCHLLASSILSGGTRLWTRDRRLAAVAEELGVMYSGHSTPDDDGWPVRERPPGEKTVVTNDFVNKLREQEGV